jgi:hypothetical protein
MERLLPELSDITVVTDTVADNLTAAVATDIVDAQLSEVFPTMKVTSKTLLSNLVICPSCGIKLQARSLAYRHKCRRNVEPTEEELEKKRIKFEDRITARFLRRTAGTGEAAQSDRQALPCTASSTCSIDFLQPSPSTEPASTPASIPTVHDTHRLPLRASQSLDTWAVR